MLPEEIRENPKQFAKEVKGWGIKHLHNIELQVKPIPFAHQIKGYMIATTLKSCGLFFDPGLGKTLVAMATIGHRAAAHQVHRALIVAPLSVTAVWQEQYEEHANYCIDYDLYLLDHRKVDERLDILKQLVAMRKKNKKDTATGKRLEIVITNYDSLRKMEPDLLKWKPDMIVADESQMIKNRQADRTKTMWKLGKLAEYKLILTGTPVTETPLDFWSQYRFLDPSIFGKRYKDFEENFAVKGGFGGFQIKRYKNLKGLARQAYSIGYRVAKKDALDLPPVIDMVRYCYLDKSSQKIYNDMEKERLIKFLGGPEADAPIVLTALLRMRQITGGFLKREDGSYVNTGQEKLNILREVLDELPEEKKIVIFATFTPEIKAIKKVVKETGRSVEELSGEVKTKDRKALRNRFQKEDLQVLVVQTAAGGVGIDLYAADTGIFYSHDPSFSKTEQAKGRLDRVGQSGDNVTFIHLLARGTIDEIIYEALQKKKNLFELVLDKYNISKEDRVMAKKHSKKQKFDRKRAAPTEKEDQEMVERLKKLKNDIEENGEVEEKGGEKKVSKKKGGKKKVKEEVVEETVQTEDAELVTVKDLADEVGVSPTVLRKKLRSMDLEKPSGRWEWPEDHPDLDVIKAEFSEEEEEEKPKKKASKKKAKKKPEPEPEPEPEEEEDDEEDEELDDEESDEEEDEEQDEADDEELDEEDDEDDWEEVDYEEMDKTELKELCNERDIHLSKKAKKSEMVDKLIAWDNARFEEEEAELEE